MTDDLPERCKSCDNAVGNWCSHWAVLIANIKFSKEKCDGFKVMQ